MRRHKVTIYLKSGDRVRFLCDDLTLERHIEGRLVRYAVTNVPKGQFPCCSVDDISAVQYQRRLLHRILYFWRK
jgi:hypothetical protein